MTVISRSTPSLTRRGAVAGAVLLLSSSTVAAPCDTRSDAADYLEPPYTVAQLRGTVVEGLTTTARMESPVGGTFHRRLTVTRVDGTGVDLRQETLEPNLRFLVPLERLRISWEQLRDYGCFPLAQATRERVTEMTPFGALSGWRYSVAEEAVRMTLFFADDYPGLPLSSKREEADLVIFLSRQVERSDVIESNGTQGDGAPDGALDLSTPGSPRGRQ